MDETIARLIQAIVEHGITLLAQIAHGAAVRKVGLGLLDATLLIFCNPRGGTPLMAANQEVELQDVASISTEIEAAPATIIFNAAESELTGRVFINIPKRFTAGFVLNSLP
ncbi:MAG: DUF302 domain-containing protein [Brachymonas sp.]